MAKREKKPPKTGKEPDVSVRGPGKPSKGDDARTVTFHAKITRNERDLWEKLAKKKGVSLSEFILRPVREKHPVKSIARKKVNKEMV